MLTGMGIINYLQVTVLYCNCKVQVIVTLACLSVCPSNCLSVHPQEIPLSYVHVYPMLSNNKFKKIYYSLKSRSFTLKVNQGHILSR